MHIALSELGCITDLRRPQKQGPRGGGSATYLCFAATDPTATNAFAATTPISI